jgi:16S rRNA (guanine966-N2)-methyltransferase
MTRIIAGRAGGRRLVTPRGSATRPTSDRVREAVFSRLEHLDVLDGATVVDLFAGSGALGLEAASRGARRVLLVDHHRGAVSAIRANAAVLSAAGVSAVVEVHADGVERVLTGPAPSGGVDLGFVDPPYDLGEAELGTVLARLVTWLAPEAVVVVERSSRSPEPLWPSQLCRTDDRRYGETRVWFAVAAPVGP